jgi:hypothetical protein
MNQNEISWSKLSLYLIWFALFGLIFDCFVWAEFVLPTQKPFLRNHSPIEYAGQNQTYGTLRDNQGMLYLASSVDGIHRYDGERWLHIPLSNNNSAFSLSKGHDGTIFVAGWSEFGFLKTEHGAVSYLSLMPKVEDPKLFEGILNVVSVPGLTAFSSDKAIMLLGEDQYKLLLLPPEEGSLQGLYTIRGKIYASTDLGSICILSMEGSKFVFRENPAFYGGNIFSNSYGLRAVQFMLPLGNNDILIGSGAQGLLRFDGTYLTPFTTQVDEAIAGQLSHAAHALGNGEFLIGTVNHGIYHLDAQGKLINHLHHQNALPSNAIFDINEDDWGQLWVSTSFGFSQLDYPAPYSYYDELSGLIGQVRVCAEWKKEFLAVGTSQGIFLSTSTNTTWNLRFNPIPGIPPSETPSLVSGPDELWAANRLGLYLISTVQRSDESLALLSEFNEISAYSFLPLENMDIRWVTASKRFSGVLWVGTAVGQLYAVHTKGPALGLSLVIDLNDPILYGGEDAEGNLWLGGYRDGAYRLSFQEDSIATPQVNNWSDKGLPKGNYSLFLVDQQVILTSDDQSFHYSKYKDIFLPDVPFLKNSHQIGIVGEGQGEIWYTQGRPRKLYSIGKNSEGSRDYPRLDLTQVRHLYFDSTGRTWLGADQQLVLLDASDSEKLKTAKNSPQPLNITSISAGAKKIYGPGLELSGELPPKEDGVPQLSHGSNDFLFQFASSCMDVSFLSLYRTKLEGLGEWSPWSRNTSQQFSQLSAGSYTLNIQARNTFGAQGETSFSFRLLPPWWETIWFYTLQVGFLLGLLLTSISMNRSGKVSRLSKNLSYVTLVVIFEAVMMVADPFKGELGFGVPALQLLCNVIFAMALEPAQGLLQRITSAEAKKD